MRSVVVNIYHFEELSDAAKEKARAWWRQDMEYPWHDDTLASLECFCDAFGVKLRNWSIGAFTHYHYRTNATHETFRGVKLKDFKRDNMPTGYCVDCDVWGTFYDRFKETGDAKQAFNDALDAGFRAWQRDIEWQYSDECTDENIIGNDYEFLSDGSRA